MKLKLLIFVLGLCAGVRSFAQGDSLCYNRQYGLKSYVVPAVCVGYGLLCWKNNGFPSSYDVKKARDEHFASFSTTADDYLVFAPGLMMLGMDLCKMKSKSNFVNQAAIGAKSVGLVLVLVNALKYTTSITRPDGSADNSFPSGHTAVAFTLAEMLHQEFKDRPLVSVAGYAIATAVGGMRLLNDKHWYSDVWVGAGIGMAATKLIYATHRYRWKMDKGRLIPVLGFNQYGFIYQL